MWLPVRVRGIGAASAATTLLVWQSSDPVPNRVNRKLPFSEGSEVHSRLTEHIVN